VLRLGVVFCVAVAVVAAALRYPAALGELGDEASRNSALSFADREIAGGNGIVVDQAAMYEARARIPADGSYRFALGDALRTDDPLTRSSVEGYARYFLLPRRPDPDAPWLICYGCDLAQYGPGARVVWQDDANISIVRLPS